MLASGALLGCPQSEFHCSSADDCAASDGEGTCEPNGYCSFEDSGCDSGRRYGEFSGRGVAGQCVPIGTASTGTTDTGDAQATTQSPSAAETQAVTTLPADSGSTVGLDTLGEGTTRGGETTSGASGDTQGGSSSGAEPQTMTFGERPMADVQGVTADTYLSAFEESFNHGGHGDLHVHGDGTPQQVSLLRFDLSALADVTIVGAQLEMYNYDQTDPGSIDVHVVLEAWTEGGVNMRPAVSNWVERQPGLLWAGPGAQAGSHDPEVITTFALTQANVAVSLAIPVGVVQTWVDQPMGNHGLLLHSDEIINAVYVASSDAQVAQERPLLVVDYLP